MAKVLFFNPPSRGEAYLSTNVGIAGPEYPSLTLATLAGHLVKKHEVKILDLEFSPRPHEALLDGIRRFEPDLVAASAVTSNYSKVKNAMCAVKANHPNLKTVVGGVHVTALTSEASREDCFDIIVIGEGDHTLSDLLELPPEKVPGIVYRDAVSGQRVRTPARGRITDLDSLAFPSWRLFDLTKYRGTKLTSKKNPVAMMESSRGCSFRCNFCSKVIFGSDYRVKSPARVVDEMETMRRCGFREIHMADDSFTQDLTRAKEICAEILRRKIRLTWSLPNGVRVDKVDADFFRLAKRAGCWQVGFGIESGNQGVLDKIAKGITLSQAEEAVKTAHRLGLGTIGFFIVGLPGDTVPSMNDTIAFAKRLPLDLAKFDVFIPFPGTPAYRELELAGKIRSKEWSRYLFHRTEEPVFDHPVLTWPVISGHYRRANREFYLRLDYVMKRVMKSGIRGGLIHDVYYALKCRW